MATNDYHFVTHWKIKGTIQEVAAVIQKPLALPDWWPAVYLEVEEKLVGEQKMYRLHTKGWLPYTIRWDFERVEEDFPTYFEIRAKGDLAGAGNWKLEQAGDYVDITYDWKVEANKPLFRYFSFILKPLFSFNHKWAMDRGQQSLQMEVDRIRQGISRIEASQPPLATFPHRHYFRKRKKTWE